MYEICLYFPVTTYGEEEVKKVFEQFESVLASDEVSVDEMLDEWATLRTLVYEKWVEVFILL